MQRLKDLSFCVLLAIVSFFLVADIFFNNGRSITFDSQIHITTMAQFASALQDGEFPVQWANNFANYGLPLGIFAHQTTAYVGALLILFTHQVVLSYNVILLMGAVLSTLLCYKFLRYYFSAEASLAGAFLFSFAPYRISNIYIRGALPEFFSSVFVWMVMIGGYELFHLRRWRGWAILMLGLLLLLLTHPMMFLITSVVFLPYLGYLQLPDLQKWLKHRSRQKLWTLVRNSSLLGSAFILSLLVASYYVIPLTAEIKYFYHGLDQQHFSTGSFLKPQNYVSPEYWFYFTRSEIGPRGILFEVGNIEMVFIGIAIVAALLTGMLRKYRFQHQGILYLGIFLCGLSIFFTLPQSNGIYQHFLPLGNIQFAWRFLSAVLLVPPLLVAWIFDHVAHRTILVSVFLILIAFIRFPQLYGKNYFSYDESRYFFTPFNLHSTNLNTIWTGSTQSYPLKKSQSKIIEGDGQIISSEVKNSSRKYQVENTNQIRMVDYTFYFPGWIVLVDNQPVSIEFQDSEYRGVITYTVPPGKHEISVKYQDTKIRKIAKIISVVGILASILFAAGAAPLLLPDRKRL